ncbi:MAG TPA: DUF1786 domain-containing protein [Syntrophaceticus sp.]|nr:DUF1786 domain-containing protein [Syntrophaceticus schinkii]MDD4261664.1 DUF1786 domain-containing protein [Syntrophaceticus schinkii]MDD4675059.1 DUF1786 domain-containing protein [Syntrophaceticus schinkii]HHY29852.1 DUF1786 domain-containing protein [Syntrophaceticus sp.]
MRSNGRILAVDIGAGTQDILLYEDGIPVENCVKLVIPSATSMVAGKIARATAAGKDIFLAGHLMGGGSSVKAMKNHLAAGLHVYATSAAAKTVRDDPREVESMGVEIVDGLPNNDCEKIELRDMDLDRLGKALSFFDVSLPDVVAVAVQDHGEIIGRSNRKFRFEHWERFLKSEGRLSDLIYRDNVPSYLTRMLAVQEDVPGAFVMDTGAAAIRGALLDPVVGSRQEDGVLVVNVGNQHTLAALLKGERIWGIFEHHTGSLTRDKLDDYLHRFVRGEVTNEEVYNDWGHGCAILPDAPPAECFDFIAITGPQRHKAEDLGYFAVPYGDMMLSGSFGLVAAVKEYQ